MRYSDDQLLAELRRLIALADPVPAPVQTAALAAFGSRARSEGGRAAAEPVGDSAVMPRPPEPSSS